MCNLDANLVPRSCRSATSIMTVSPVVSPPANIPCASGAKQKMLVMPEPWCFSRIRPVIEFVLVATEAAVKQIFRAVIAAFSQRLKMVNRQFAAHINFSDTAILAGEIRPPAYLFTEFGADGHGKVRRVARQVVRRIGDATVGFRGARLRFVW